VNDEAIGALVEQALGGDQDAVAALYRLYEKRMINAVHLRLGHTLHGLMESVDLVQSVWKDALCNLDRFEYRGPDSFYRWMHSCLINKINMKRRYHGASKRDAKRGGVLNDAQAAPDPTPSAVVMGNEDQDRLVEIMNGFPELQRRVLILRMRDEMDYPDIAEAVGKSVDATRKIYQRGLRKLIDQLPREWRDEGDARPDRG
jgi:RNA polymerase sigma-70 factor (ECF subfamily)